MLDFSDIDAAKAVASGLLGLVAGVILGPVLDRKFFEKERHRRAEAELDRLKVLLNKRRSERPMFAIAAAGAAALGTAPAFG